MPPSCSISASTTPAASGVARSCCATKHRWPRSSIAAAVSAAPDSSVLNVMPTSKPSVARSSAVALPMPESAPVTMASRAGAGMRAGPESAAGSVMPRALPAWAAADAPAASADAEQRPDRPDREVDDEQSRDHRHQPGHLCALAEHQLEEHVADEPRTDPRGDAVGERHQHDRQERRDRNL